MNLTPDLTHYLELGFGLIHLPVGAKAPQGNGWQNSPVTTLEQAARTWRCGGNVGLHHAASRTAVLDIDHPEWAALALAAVDISLEVLLTAPGPKIRGAKGPKPVYRLPDGLELGRKVLAWKRPDADTVVTVLELRAGKVQDVLPPSIHPDTGSSYTWEPEMPQRREDIPELPGNLRTLWENWGVLKPILDKAQPCTEPPPPRTYKGEEGDVIGSFNDRYNVREILERNDYAAKSAERYLSPHSSTGTPGIVVLKGDDGLERVYCHHASDPLYSEEHSHDAFSVFTTLECDGDVKAAVKAAAADLGMSYKETPYSNQQKTPVKTERRTASKPRPMLTRLADVEPQDVAWLWHPYIPLGKLTLLEGDPGLGKTFLALTLAAIITKGYPFPGQDGGMGGAREPENVLYMSAEDGLADTLRPRLDAAGADVSRVHALTGWQAEDAEGETVEGAVSLAHIAVLEQTMQKIQPRLVMWIRCKRT